MSPDKAIIISTHLLDEVEAVCSRAIIIARGRILADGTPTELAARSRYHNAVRVGLPAAGTDPTIAAGLAGLAGIASIERASDGEGDGLWLFSRDQRPIIAEVAELVRARGWMVTGIRAERGRLDDVFRAITMPQARAPDPAREAA
jgi:ABC-2 type transport system ATP-binding protein